MKLFIRLLFLFILVSNYSLITYADQLKLYQGFPEIDKLRPAIINSPLFNQAPLPTAKVLTYESTEVATNKKFSRYQIQILETKGYISRYRTREVDPRNKGFFITKNTPIIRGEGVGYGGIFMLAYEKWHSTGDQALTAQDYYKKYEMTSISDVKAKLFPLAVGNQLSFNYAERYKTTEMSNNLEEVTDSGKMVYQVVDRLNGYTYANISVPGDIYVIRVSRTTRENSQLSPMYEYYFSTKLGWYILAKYFRNNQLVAIYRLINWE